MTIFFNDKMYKLLAKDKQQQAMIIGQAVHL